MRYLIAGLCLAWLCGDDTAKAQNEGAQHYVAVPLEAALLTVAAQPESPLQVENAQLLIGMDGRPGVSCDLRNRGTKPIRTYNLALWTSLATGWTIGPTDVSPRKPLLAGGVIKKSPPGGIIPLTEELRDRLKLRGPMRAVMVLMVLSVEFADGTTYSAESTSKALLEHLEGLAK